MRHPWILALIAVGALLPAACSKAAKQPEAKQSTQTCDSLHDRNRRCATQLAEIITDKMTANFPAETKKKLGDRIAKSIVKGDFAAKCRAQWASTDARDREVKAALLKCLAIKGCQPYAKCFLEAMDLGRKQPPAPAPDKAMAPAPDKAMAPAPGKAMAPAPKKK